jgi:DNA-binding transcriptional MocR family regulator
MAGPAAFGHSEAQRPMQQEIAATIGTSRETVARALSEPARRGFIEVSGRRLLVRRGLPIASGDEE